MKCSYFQSALCRSCTLLDKSYESTLTEKQKQLEALFPGDTAKISGIVGVSNPLGSRNKVKLAAFEKGDTLQFGYYDSAGRATELEHCPLHEHQLNDLLPVLKIFFQKAKVEAYDLATKKGELKYVLLSSSEKDIMARFVLRSKESLDRIRKLIPEFLQECPNVKVVTANIQPLHAAVLEGDEEIVLSEQKVIWHQFDEFKLALGVRSFFQVTPEMARKLYGALSEKIKVDQPANLIDLYCGVGAFAFYSSRACEKITGVEISPEAISCAKLSNEVNKKQISFHALDVERYLMQTHDVFEAVLVNPPRRGLNTQIISSILRMHPERIYYSSCNAFTMQRDFEELRAFYEITDMKIFDMFPYTDHFETLMCLVRKRQE